MFIVQHAPKIYRLAKGPHHFGQATMNRGAAAPLRIRGFGKALKIPGRDLAHQPLFQNHGSRALTIFGRGATFKQKDRIAERRHCRDTPAANAPVDDVLRAVGIDANNLAEPNDRSALRGSRNAKGQPKWLPLPA